MLSASGALKTHYPLVGMDQVASHHAVALKQGMAEPPPSGLHRDALQENEFFFFASVFHFFATDSTISPQIAHFRQTPSSTVIMRKSMDIYNHDGIYPFIPVYISIYPIYQYIIRYCRHS
jgi:hypothetical protein